MPTPHPQGRNRHTDAENGLEDTGGDVEGLSEQHGRTPSCVNSQGRRWAARGSPRRSDDPVGGRPVPEAGPRTRVADARCPTAEASTAP